MDLPNIILRHIGPKNWEYEKCDRGDVVRYEERVDVVHQYAVLNSGKRIYLGERIKNDYE